MSFDGEIDRLYKNLGNDKFQDVTREMGVFNANGRAMGVGAADYDADGVITSYSIHYTKLYDAYSEHF